MTNANPLNLAVGTKVYYTGDMANSSGTFEVSFVGNGYINLKELDGDRHFKGIYFSQVGGHYEGHCNPRFVTDEARQAWRRLAAGRR